MRRSPTIATFTPAIASCARGRGRVEQAGGVFGTLAGVDDARQADRDSMWQPQRRVAPTIIRGPSPRLRAYRPELAFHTLEVGAARCVSALSRSGDSNESASVLASKNG